MYKPRSPELLNLNGFSPHRLSFLSCPLGSCWHRQVAGSCCGLPWLSHFQDHLAAECVTVTFSKLSWKGLSKRKLPEELERKEGWPGLPLACGSFPKISVSAAGILTLWWICLSPEMSLQSSSSGPQRCSRSDPAQTPATVEESDQSPSTTLADSAAYGGAERV